MVASIRQSSEAISPTIWEWSRKVGDSTSNARSASAPRNHIELSQRVFLRLEYHCFVGRISWFEAKTASIRNAVRAYLAHPIYAFYAFEFCLYDPFGGKPTCFNRGMDSRWLSTARRSPRSIIEFAILRNIWHNLFMRKTYKYRIYPSPTQSTILNKQLEASRMVYNRTLAVRQSSYENLGISVGLYDTQKLLTGWKKEYPALKIVHSQVLQNVQMRVDLAFQAFFRRVKAHPEGTREAAGYPRFKGDGRYDSLTYPQYGNGVRLDGNMLILSKVGSIKVKLHRELCGTAKTVCVRRAAGNKWYATISCEHIPEPLPYEPKAVGIDVGTSTFGTLSDGTKIANPRFFKREQKVLAMAQRRLEKVAKGTPAREKRKAIISRIHARIANKRSDFAHKLSRQLVNTYGVIALEDLNIVGMMAEHKVIFGNKLNKSHPEGTRDVAWHQFAQFVVYKAADAGRRCVQVDPRNTSKMCSRCRMLVPKELSDRIHDCPHCGLVLDRDHNAAINILALGLQGVNAGSPDEVVEAHPL